MLLSLVLGLDKNTSAVDSGSGAGWGNHDNLALPVTRHTEAARKLDTDTINTSVYLLFMVDSLKLPPE